ncbi:pectate lyase [Roseateles sp. BYS96W]|uniref:Pectate lyase n=1 Tax=Pelomonas nitida TaxID=3299027 RepID=A0ABW7G5W3_9BURK
MNSEKTQRPISRLWQGLLGLVLMAVAGTAAAAPSARTVPACTKVNVSATIDVPAGTTWDGVAKYGKWVCLVGTASNMKGTQSESQIPMFKLNNGSTVKNVVIGDGSLGSGTNLAAGGADGVHCYGVCNITNVYWADVGEDGATVKKLSGVTSKLTISGGAAFKAKDKLFQHNGDGTLVIQDFYADNIGKLVRSCGNCSTQYARKVTVSGVRLGTVNSAGIGVNSSYDSKSGISGKYDVATITDLVYSGSKAKCEGYVGTGSGNEPVKDTSSSNVARACVFK